MNTFRMPALFLGHGSPMNVLEENSYTQAWRTLGETLPRPKMIFGNFCPLVYPWYGGNSDGTSPDNSRFWRVSTGAI